VALDWLVCAVISDALGAGRVRTATIERELAKSRADLSKLNDQLSAQRKELKLPDEK
jgi:hypothetical protein